MSLISAKMIVLRRSRKGCPMDPWRGCAVMLIGTIAGALAAPAAAAEKDAKQAGRIKIYRMKIHTNFAPLPDTFAKDKWEDVSPTKYDVWCQPYKGLSLKDHHAFIVDAHVKEPTLPFPAAGRRGLRVAFQARGYGPFVYIYVRNTKGSGSPNWRAGSCGVAYLVTPWGPHKQLDGTIKPDCRTWLGGTYTKEFKYKLTKTRDGRDKLIVHHVTGVGWHPDERRTIIWEFILGDWFATIRLPEESDVRWIGYHRHERIVAIPGRGDRGKDIVLDAGLEPEGQFPFPTDGQKHLRIPIDPASRRRYALVHSFEWNTKWYRPKKGVAYLPFIWWEKTGSGEGWAFRTSVFGESPKWETGSSKGGYNVSGCYQCIGRADAKSAGLIRLGGIPMLQTDLLRTDTTISKTLQPGRYRRLARVGKQWKFDQIIEANEKNIGKDVPAKVVGDEYLYLVDDLEEKIFSSKGKQQSRRERNSPQYNATRVPAPFLIR